MKDGGEGRDRNGQAALTVKVLQEGFRLGVSQVAQKRFEILVDHAEGWSGDVGRRFGRKDQEDLSLSRDWCFMHARWSITGTTGGFTDIRVSVGHYCTGYVPMLLRGISFNTTMTTKADILSQLQITFLSEFYPIKFIDDKYLLSLYDDGGGVR